MIRCVHVGVSRPRDVDGTRRGDSIRAAELFLAMLFSVARHAVADRVAVFVVRSGRQRAGLCSKSKEKLQTRLRVAREVVVFVAAYICAHSIDSNEAGM